MNAAEWDRRIREAWPELQSNARRALANLLATASEHRLRRCIVVLDNRRPRRPLVLLDDTLSASRLATLHRDPECAGVVSGAQITRLLEPN